MMEAKVSYMETTHGHTDTYKGNAPYPDGHMSTLLLSTPQITVHNLILLTKPSLAETITGAVLPN